MPPVKTGLWNRRNVLLFRTKDAHYILWVEEKSHIDQAIFVHHPADDAEKCQLA
jgi:hypothetical protein